MKNTIGQSIAVTLFGESHGAAVGAVVDGLAPGLPVDLDVIAAHLSRRRPQSATDTARRERDKFDILSGVFEGRTTGTPLTVVIPNEDTRSRDYHYGVARPAHADLAAHEKYHGFEDYRGGGHFSGRVTAALVAVGGILIPALAAQGIEIGTHIAECGGACDRAFDGAALLSDIRALRTRAMPVLDDASATEMEKRILEASAACDSIGGITETVIAGLPAGLGEPWFDSVEGLLSHAMFSLGGVKGIEFGLGFGFSGARGSTANDAFRVKNGRIVTETNHNGGINGGITNGMPVCFRLAVKPTPSIAQPQKTVDFQRMKNTELTVEGRHDPTILRRICPVVDSVAAIVVADLLATRYGTDVLRVGLPK